MAEAYTVFWAQERCAALRRLGGLGKPLHLLFGGPHTSERDLSKYIRDGRLTGILGVQGIYRLSEDSQRDVEALVIGANTASQAI